MDMVRNWLLEYSCSKGYSEVLKKLININGDGISYQANLQVRSIMCCLTNMVNVGDVSQYPLAERILCQLQKTFPESINHKLFCKLQTGLKIMVLVNNLRNGQPEATLLAQLNEYFPRDGIINSKLNEKVVGEVNAGQTEFRKLYFSLMTSRSRRKVFFEHEYGPVFGDRFKDRLKHLTSQVVKQIEDNLTTPVLEMLLGATKEERNRMSQAHSVAVEILLDCIYEKSDLTEADMLQMLDMLIEGSSQVSSSQSTPTNSFKKMKIFEDSGSEREETSPTVISPSPESVSSKSSMASVSLIRRSQTVALATSSSRKCALQSQQRASTDLQETNQTRSRIIRAKSKAKGKGKINKCSSTRDAVKERDSILTTGSGPQGCEEPVIVPHSSCDTDKPISAGNLPNSDITVKNMKAAANELGREAEIQPLTADDIPRGILLEDVPFKEPVIETPRCSKRKCAQRSLSLNHRKRLRSNSSSSQQSPIKKTKKDKDVENSSQNVKEKSFKVDKDIDSSDSYKSPPLISSGEKSSVTESSDERSDTSKPDQVSIKENSKISEHHEHGTKYLDESENIIEISPVQKSLTNTHDNNSSGSLQITSEHLATQKKKETSGKKNLSGEWVLKPVTSGYDTIKKKLSGVFEYLHPKIELSCDEVTSSNQTDSGEAELLKGITSSSSQESSPLGGTQHSSVEVTSTSHSAPDAEVFTGGGKMISQGNSNQKELMYSTQKDELEQGADSTDWGISQIPHLPPQQLRTFFSNIHEENPDPEICFSLNKQNIELSSQIKLRNCPSHAPCSDDQLDSHEFRLRTQRTKSSESSVEDLRINNSWSEDESVELNTSWVLPSSNTQENEQDPSDIFTRNVAMRQYIDSLPPIHKYLKHHHQKKCLIKIYRTKVNGLEIYK